MPVVANMTWFRGEAYLITDSIKTLAGAAEDVTGWTFAFTVRRGYVSKSGVLVQPGAGGTWTPTGADPAVLLQKTSGAGVTITNAVGGLVAITVLADDTLALDVGGYAYDLWRVDAGAEALLTVGNLKVKPAVRE